MCRPYGAPSFPYAYPPFQARCARLAGWANSSPRLRRWISHQPRGFPTFWQRDVAVLRLYVGIFPIPKILLKADRSKGGWLRQERLAIFQNAGSGFAHSGFAHREAIIANIFPLPLRAAACERQLIRAAAERFRGDFQHHGPSGRSLLLVEIAARQDFVAG